jgi:DegV family protein with EDD domain
MVHIITDTTACFPEILTNQYHVPIIPQIINFGEESYYEGVQIDTDTFMRRLRASTVLPKTAAPPPELFAEVFRRLVPTGEPILCIHPSAEVSGTVRSATVAALDFPGADIRVIDTRIVASPLGTMVQLAAMGNKAQMQYHRPRLDNLIAAAGVLPTLLSLPGSGRIGEAAAGRQMLQIKPILTLADGKVDVYERERTHRRALARLKEIVAEQAPHDGQAYLTVMHADVFGEAQALAVELGQTINQPDVPITHVPPAVVTHGGPGFWAWASS